MHGVKRSVAELRAAVKKAAAYREKCSLTLSAAMGVTLALDQVCCFHLTAGHGQSASGCIRTASSAQWQSCERLSRKQLPTGKCGLTRSAAMGVTLTLAPRCAAFTQHLTSQGQAARASTCLASKHWMSRAARGCQEGSHISRAVHSSAVNQVLTMACVQAVHSGLSMSHASELITLCNEVTIAVDLAEARVKVRLPSGV